MAKLFILYLFIIIFASGIWLFSSSVFSKVGKPFTYAYKKFKENMEEK